ncbi:MAG: hypothetical protein KZQ75_01505 [Candidatus Thiodiazotropha sp. (ex Myrtea spinifera)]|nr:hypothetical protein [Candidatus Thiodiazotropha sp. (ex Myrtea spinifera)]
MHLGQRWICLFILALAQLPAWADIRQQSLAFCREQALSGPADCHLQPCPCNAGEKTLKTFTDPSDGTAFCACRSQMGSDRAFRRQAADACNKHRAHKHESCFVSRGDCPRGFEALATFGDKATASFTACRDYRHERPQKPNDLANLDHHALQQESTMDQYRHLTDALTKGRKGESSSLPNHTIERLAHHFRSIPLDALTFTHTNALTNGCFSDCDQIFCANAKTIDQWTRIQNPVISLQLLHQIAHAESCRLQGGRHRFVPRWYQHLPDKAHQQLRQGEPVDTRQIHFAMFMENQAEHRAESICRRLVTCLRD